LARARPIIFTGWSIEKIRDRQKTATRRIVRHLRPGTDYRISGPHIVNGQPTCQWSAFTGTAARGQHVPFTCLYGNAGDHLWVKEDFATRLDAEHKTIRVRYPADGKDGPVHVVPAELVPPQYWTSTYVSRRSRHMPKWAARIWLEVTAIRVERLQSITEEDAKLEGVEPWYEADLRPDGELREGPSIAYRAGFHDSWDGIYAKQGYGFDANPFVWVCAFRVLEPRQ
jgi:hypothetical protein